MKKNRQLLRVNHKYHSTLTAGAIRAITYTAYSIEANYYKCHLISFRKCFQCIHGSHHQSYNHADTY